MTDNRALWELVEKWRADADVIGSNSIGRAVDDCADELAAILERPVVVGDDIEKMARHLCQKLGEEPDGTESYKSYVQAEQREVIVKVPNWHGYTEYAKAALSFLMRDITISGAEVDSSLKAFEDEMNRPLVVVGNRTNRIGRRERAMRAALESMVRGKS